MMFFGSVLPGHGQSAPTIGTQPLSQTNLAGTAVTFSVVVAGRGPFVYQWQFDGTNLANNMITTVAGTGALPYAGDGGPAINAPVWGPSGVALDPSGNLYIADGGHDRIRKVDTNGIITTVAGDGGEDFSGDGVAATNTSLSSPNGVAFDASGNWYIADSANERVRKVDVNGTITTVAGNGNNANAGNYSGDGGAATNATLAYPFGVGLDLLGNLYVADAVNNRIRRVDTNGIIATVAGNGTATFAGDNGAATNASLNYPEGVYLDGLGNLYIADSGNNRVRMVATNGVITTVAGGGTGGDGGAATNANLNQGLASVNTPLGVAMGADGNLYIADGNKCAIRKVDTNGIITTVAGNGSQTYAGDGGAATNASLNLPNGVALDAIGNLFIADTANNRIREVHFAGYPALALANITPANAGNYSVIITGPYGSVTSSVATLTVVLPPAIIEQPLTQGGSNAMIGMVATGTQPLYYNWYYNSTNLVQAGTNSALGLTNLTGFNFGQYVVVVTNLYGSVTSQPAILAAPPFIVSQPAGQFVLAGSNFTFSVPVSASLPLVYQWQLNGTNLPDNLIATVAGGGLSNPGDGGTATNAVLQSPGGVAADGQGNYYIADGLHNRVRRVDTNNNITTVAGNGVAAFAGDQGPATNASLNSPQSVALDAAGDLFIADYSNQRIRKVDTNGIITTVAGNGTAGYAGDNTAATNTSLNLPRGVAVDALGNLYIADYENNRVRKVDTNGIIATVAGTGSFSFSGDGGPATNATLRYPEGVAVDVYNNLYIADHNNGRVRRVDTNGIIATVAGNGSSAFSGDGGPAVDAGIYNPIGITVDAYGYLFIADQQHQRIRQVDPDNIITTVAGNGFSNAPVDGGAATNATLFVPSGVAVAASGGLLIADTGNNRIRAITLGRSPLLQLGRVTTNNAGNYDAIITNPYGSVTSSIAPLTVVFLQLSNQTVFAGSNVSLSATATGPLPNAYQWQFNGANPAWATNALLVLTNVQPANQGYYDVLISNGVGLITPPGAILTVTGFPPAIVTVQPAIQALVAGSNYTFTATVNGSPQLSYQWQFNGTNLPWATNVSLTLSNAQVANEGYYTIIATNSFAAATNANALLTDLSTALNTPGLIWTNAGGASWFPETTITHDGIEAAQSGVVANGQRCVLQTTVTGPGTLTFWWMFQPLAVPLPNYLSFSTSQSNVSASVTSTTGWQQEVCYLGAGTQALDWAYFKSSIISGQSTGWVDQVSFVPGGTAPIIGYAPGELFVRANAAAYMGVFAAGTPPLSYQWQFNGTNLVNQTNFNLTILDVQPASAGTYSVVITNNYGSASTNVALFVQQFSISSGSTNLSMTTNGFQLLLNGVLTANPVLVLESTDLVNWLPIYTNSPTTGSVKFIDFTATNLPARFYRAQE